MSRRTISLFTGAGGLDLGMEAAGFENAVAVEMDPIAVRTLEAPANRHRWGAVLGADIHSLLEVDPKTGRRSARNILTAGGLKAGDADLLVGGPPCQPFSKSGYWAQGDAKRLDDPRARTLEAYLDVLEDALPTVFLLENVPGLKFSAKDEGFQFLRKRIAQINRRKDVKYSFCAAQLNAAEYGVPQLRERVFIVGHRDGKEFNFPTPRYALPPRVDMANGEMELGDYPVPEGLLPATTAWDAIGHLEDDRDPQLRPRGKWAPVLSTIPEGANYLWHTSRGRGLKLWGWRTRYWSMLLKLAKNRPSWTLTAQPGPAIGPFHWKNRRLSARELAGLQTFPEEYEIVGDVRDAHFQLGNAVPSALAEMLGRAIRTQLLGDPGVEPMPTLLPKLRRPIPPAEPPSDPRKLPKSILTLVSEKADHPGTGQGPGAKARRPAA